MDIEMDPWSEAAINQNRRWLSAYLMAFTGDRATLEDMVQEVYRIAFEKRDTFEKGAVFGAWLRGIARNVGLQYCRRSRRTPLLDHDDAVEMLDRTAAESEEASMSPAFAEEKIAILRECMAQLAEPVRRLIDLKYRAGLSLARIAEMAGKKLAAVNVAIFRGREALRMCLERKERRAGI